MQLSVKFTTEDSLTQVQLDGWAEGLASELGINPSQISATVLQTKAYTISLLIVDLTASTAASLVSQLDSTDKLQHLVSSSGISIIVESILEPPSIIGLPPLERLFFDVEGVINDIERAVETTTTANIAVASDGLVTRLDSTVVGGVTCVVNNVVDVRDGRGGVDMALGLVVRANQAGLALQRLQAIIDDGSLVQALQTQRPGGYMNIESLAVPTEGPGSSGPVVGGPVGSACGDHVRTHVEECDDGNQNNGDGCHADCTVEPGHSCTGDVGSTSVCFMGTGRGGGQDAEGSTGLAEGCPADCVVIANRCVCPDEVPTSTGARASSGAMWLAVVFVSVISALGSQ